MSSESSLEFNILHVEPTNQLRGDVNVTRIIERRANKESNIVAADAAHLPFRDEAFNVALSSSLELFSEPATVLKEMHRVAKVRVSVQYIHKWASTRRISGGKNFFGPEWFKSAAKALGCRGIQLINRLDYPLSGRLQRILPKARQNTLLFRLLRHFERLYLPRIHWFPLEIEAWLQKQPKHFSSAALRFVVVYNLQEAFQKFFSSSRYVLASDTIAYFNKNGEPLPKFYNDTVHRHLSEDLWFVFCHQDFIFLEELKERLRFKDTEAVYGPIGVRLNENLFIGQIIQTNDQPTGVRLEKDMHVQTLDAQCLIAHSSVFRQGLWFDERFRFHFYDADFCLRAYKLGFEVYATQISCQHKSRTITGDLDSPEYVKSLGVFREKWKKLLPIKTSTTTVTYIEEKS